MWSFVTSDEINMVQDGNTNAPTKTAKVIPQAQRDFGCLHVSANFAGKYSFGPWLHLGIDKSINLIYRKNEERNKLGKQTCAVLNGKKKRFLETYHKKCCGIFEYKSYWNYINLHNISLNK